ncbi:unnamed protein product [Cercopithifilaria johnstoni]|uniref:Uncharacterized protein n=1 Tax=Cercopithifilaria johnstoni TaxID=2874296 RepID=A0A8J2M669_9BILA|nr:unnamed protein product [Cercopithifilaria johnstoni]
MSRRPSRCEHWPDAQLSIHFPIRSVEFKFWRIRRFMLQTMLEVLINRRFLLLGTVVSLVTFIFFVCIYRLENIYGGDFTLKKFVTWNIQRSTIKSMSRDIQPLIDSKREKIKVSDGPTSKLPDHMCYKHEPFIVLERCIACSQFEQNAVRAAYCLETGFYDKVNCWRSKHLGLKPCYGKANRSEQFNLFTLLCAFCSLVSYSFVNWRQNMLRKQGFMRIQNQFN